MLKDFGFVIDDAKGPLLNLRFADVLLFARIKDAGKNIAHLAGEDAKYGLKLHLGNTLIMSTAADNKSIAAAVRIEAEVVGILGQEGAEK